MVLAGRIQVSTHSRLKAAGCLAFHNLLSYFGFNTQPPEGGWASGHLDLVGVARPFQHTAA